MSLDAKQSEARPISSVDELVGFFRAAEKGRSPKLIGLEHEKLIYPSAGAAPVPYPGGIEKVLSGFARFGWSEFREGPGLPVIAMTRGAATLSLEPGSAYAHDIKAHILAALGRRKEAAAEFKKALDIDPELQESVDGLKALEGGKP